MIVHRWKNDDSIQLRKALETLIPSAIQEVLGYRTRHRVLSSNITETTLQPEGHQITISLSVQITRKEEPVDDSGVSEQPGV